MAAGEIPFTKMEELPADDVVNSPRHYLSPFPLPRIFTKSNQQGRSYTQVIDVMKAWGFHKDAFMFNCLTYIFRAGSKPGNAKLQEYKKARFYLDEAIAQLERDEASLDVLAAENREQARD